MDKSIKVHIVLFSVALIYGVTYSMAKDIMPYYIQGFGLIVLRVFGATILFIIASRFIKKEKVDWKKHGKRIFLCSLFGVVANMLMFFKGLEITHPINAAVLMLVTPIFVFILNIIINKQKLIIVQVIGILMAGVGSVFMMMNTGFQFSQQTMPGDILIILNAVSFALFLVLARDLMRTYHVITVSKYTFLFGSLMVIPFGYKELTAAKFAEMGTGIILEILFIIIFTTFIAFLLNAWAIMKAGPTIVGAYIYLQPILAAIIAIMLKKDVITMQKVLAILLIFAGVYITSTKITWYKSKA